MPKRRTLRGGFWGRKVHDDCKEWEKYFNHCKTKNRFTLKWRPCRKLYDNMNRCSKLKGNSTFLDFFEFHKPHTMWHKTEAANLSHLLAQAKEEYDADMSHRS